VIFCWIGYLVFVGNDADKNALCAHFVPITSKIHPTLPISCQHEAKEKALEDKELILKIKGFSGMLFFTF